MFPLTNVVHLQYWKQQQALSRRGGGLQQHLLLLSFTLNNLRWARQKPQEYIGNPIQCRLRRLVWFLSWRHRVKLEKKIAGKAFQWGEEKKSNFDRAVRQSHLLPLQRVFHIVRSHHQSPRSSAQIDPCKCAMMVAHCVLAWLQQLFSSESGAPPTVGRTLWLNTSGFGGHLYICDISAVQTDPD